MSRLNLTALLVAAAGIAALSYLTFDLVFPEPDGEIPGPVHPITVAPISVKPTPPVILPPVSPPDDHLDQPKKKWIPHK